ncbi:MAG: cytochrome c maturation protein CcmE [Anaerolineae bacterium]|nr:MAG: cytochrome c maturation protein CcmE [Anaerolineae bacterium]
MSRSTKAIIGLLIIVPVAAHLVYSLWRGSLTGYYLTVDEALAYSGSPAGMRVAGKVAPGSLEWDGQQLHFTLTEGGQTLPVVYPGPAPDLLGPGRTAIVEGRLGAEGLFVANRLILKCPHSYVEL